MARMLVMKVSLIAATPPPPTIVAETNISFLSSQKYLFSPMLPMTNADNLALTLTAILQVVTKLEANHGQKVY